MSKARKLSTAITLIQEVRVGLPDGPEANALDYAAQTVNRVLKKLRERPSPRGGVQSAGGPFPLPAEDYVAREVTGGRYALR